MSSAEVFSWLENLGYSHAIRTSTWLFPTIETAHVLALALVVGSISMLDLRLLGIASRERAVTQIAAEILPWTWTGFATAALSGFLLFSSAAVKYSADIPFRLKMLLLVLAAANMAVFHSVIYRAVGQWDRAMMPP